MESFYYEDEGFDRLRENETAEASFEVDVELSPGVISGVEKLILEKRKGMDTDGNPKKRITEKYLRYSVTIQILPKTGYLRIKLECADTKQCNQEISQRLY